MATGRPLSVASVREPRPRARRHTVMAVVVAGYLLAAAVVVATARVSPAPRWLALHLVGLGAATNAVMVWSRHFAQAVLHARLRSERAAVARLAALNVGVAGVLAGVTADAGAVAGIAAGVVVVAVSWHVSSLVAMLRGHRLPGRLRPVVWFYVASGVSLVTGAAFGAVIAAGAVADDSVVHRRLHLAHAQLNLLGWIGLAVLGTEVLLWPAVLRTRMHDRAPGFAPWTLAACAAGLAVLTAGGLIGSRWTAAAGAAVYTVGVVVAADPLVRTVLGRRPREAPPWLLGAGTCWLAAGLVVDVDRLARTTDPDVVLRPLVPMLAAGLVVQVLVGALTYLLPVTIGGGPVGNRRLAARLERAWPVRFALGNAGLVAAVVPAGHVVHILGWASVVVGFGSFVPLLGAALVARPGAR